MNCCVPGCQNNFRNSVGIKFYRIPKNEQLRKRYVQLLRNETLKLKSDNTRICSEHFEGGYKATPDHLPSIFPWSKKVEKRRQLNRLSQEQLDEIPKKRTGRFASYATQTEVCNSGKEVACDTRDLAVGECPLSKNVATQTDETVEYHNNSIATQTPTYRNTPFDLNDFKERPEDVSFYTGFENYETLMLCYSIIEEPAQNLSYGTHERKSFSEVVTHGRPRILSKFEEFVLVLMKLRLGLFNRDLAHRFKVSRALVSVIFITWIRFLGAELGALIRLPCREVIKLHMPPLIKQYYPNCVMIIDCTEVEIERPSALDNQSATYSSYKSRNTAKCLVGITPSGVPCFVSPLYPGSISDKEITMKSGILNLLQQGDEIMADKGFLIQDELASVGASLVMPAFLKNRKQFTKEENILNKKVASLRVHVERCMERLKNWHILDAKLSVSLSPISSDMFTVIAALTTFQSPLISLE